MAARWWPARGFGYSRRGMKAPRTAHWLVVPMLALGMAMAPVRAHAAPAKPTGETEPAPSKKGKAKRGEAPKGEAPKGEAPKVEAPSEESGEAPAEEPGEVEAAPEVEAGTAPEAETPPEAGTPPAGEPTEAPATTEPPLEPEITVQPRPVEPSAATSPAPTSIASREVVVDPRRLRSDDRILFRAGILSLGVAAAAVVPTVVGFQQAYVAHVDDDPARERTMRGLGIGAGVAAGTYAITGIVLMSLGARQRRAALAPAVGPGQLGAVLRARF